MGKYLLAAVLIVALIVVLATLSSAQTSSRTVTLNLAFNINNKTNDGINSSNTSVSASGNSTVIALAFSGQAAFNASVSREYSASNYIINLTQALDGNLFLLAVAPGDDATIKNRTGLLGGGKILGTSFAAPQRSKESVPFFIAALYKVDISNATAFSGIGTLRIRNRGLTQALLPNITIERTK